LASLKQEMDPGMKKIAGKYDLTGVISVVTGANSGTGYGIVQMLASKGAEVVMACRSLQRCRSAQMALTQALDRDYLAARDKAAAAAAANASAVIPVIVPGKLHALEMDLGDLASVRAFADQVAATFPRVDVLVNNAGFIGVPGDRTKQGLEGMLGVMHVGHFALTKWLMPLLLKVEDEEPADAAAAAGKGSHNATSHAAYNYASTARVINIASQVWATGTFDGSLVRGDGGGDLHGELTDNCAHLAHVLPCCPFLNCPVSNGYARAKLANVLHVQELQRRSDLQALEEVRNGRPAPRRLVTASLHPGTVHTGLVSWFSSYWLSTFLRTPLEAAMITLKAVENDKYVPSSYIDGMGTPHDLQDYRERHMKVHLEAFPDVVRRSLPFVKTPALPVWGLDKKMFETRQFVKMPADGPVAHAAAVAMRLWDVTDHFINTWEEGQR